MAIYIKPSIFKAEKNGYVLHAALQKLLSEPLSSHITIPYMNRFGI